MLKLVQTNNGVFDLAFDDPALNDTDAKVATLIYAALFTDQEAPEGRVVDRYERRGWWNDPQAGTGLWYVRRQPLSSAARREALDMVRDALTAREAALQQVEVEEIEHPGSSGSVSSVFLRFSGFHNGEKLIVEMPLNPS